MDAFIVFFVISERRREGLEISYSTIGKERGEEFLDESIRYDQMICVGSEIPGRHESTVDCFIYYVRSKAERRREQVGRGWKPNVEPDNNAGRDVEPKHSTCRYFCSKPTLFYSSRTCALTEH